MRPLRVLVWHVHGSWLTAFVQGRHHYLLPTTPDRGPDGMGRARTWEWPATTLECTPEQLRDEPVDVVVLQRPQDLELAGQWLGRRPGRDVPAVWLEHNAPEPHPVRSRHPMAEQRAIPVVHVTAFNDLFWDNGVARTRVIEHGILDPGERYTGELARAGVVVNEPVRRGRMVGTDLLGRFAAVAPVDVFGMQVGALAEVPGVTPHEDLEGQEAMHARLARRRVYVHLVRWTSLGLSLLEAMHLGLPVVAVAATEVVEAVPPEAGVVSTDVNRLLAAMHRYVNEPEEARVAGKHARRAALARYGLGRFLDEWDDLLAEVVG